MKMVQEKQIVGILECAYSGETKEYDDANKFISDYVDDLNYYSVRGVKAILVDSDPHLEYTIRKITIGEFGYDAINIVMPKIFNSDNIASESI